MQLSSRLKTLVGDRRHRDVAIAVGVSRAAVSQWLSGTTSPSRSNLVALLDYLGVEDPAERNAVLSSDATTAVAP